MKVSSDQLDTGTDPGQIPVYDWKGMLQTHTPSSEDDPTCCVNVEYVARMLSDRTEKLAGLEKTVDELSKHVANLTHTILNMRSQQQQACVTHVAEFGAQFTVISPFVQSGICSAVTVAAAHYPLVIRFPHSGETLLIESPNQYGIPNTVDAEVRNTASVRVSVDAVPAGAHAPMTFAFWFEKDCT